MNTPKLSFTLFVMTLQALLTPTYGQSTRESPSDYAIVEFPSEGATLRGRLYMPEGDLGTRGIIVMAHGYSATIDGMVADRYAEIFYRAGYAVLLYDHRNFGISGGEPRQEINVWRQARGYRDAISFVYELPEIDREKIVIWGDSMAAGEVIAVGALDQRVKAIISQIPSCGDAVPRDDSDGELFASIVDTFHNGNIEATPENTWGPLPVVSSSPEHLPSVMKPNTAFRWFIEYGGRYGTNWINSVTHVTPDVPVYLEPGICVIHVTVPLLMVVAAYDEMPHCSSEISKLVYERAPGPKQLHIMGGGHFGLVHYPSPLFDESSRVQVEFLKQHFR